MRNPNRGGNIHIWGRDVRRWENSVDPKPIVGRRRFRQELALKERLLASAREARDRAALLPPGPERQKLLKDARYLKTTADLDSWISSPGLAPPK